MTRSFAESFGHALRGLSHALRTQRNLRFHFVAAAAAIFGAIALPLAAVELLFVASAIASVVGTELLNTAIEAAVDRIGPERHPLSGAAKDAAAAAALVASLYALAVGAFTFGAQGWPPRLREPASLWLPVAAAPSLVLLAAVAVARLRAPAPRAEPSA